MKTTTAMVRGAAFTLAALLAYGCGGGGGGGSGGVDPPPGPVSMAITGVAVVKVRGAGVKWMAMTERLLPLAEVVRPDRRMVVSADGRTVAARYEAPAGWSLVDFALHPSGEATLVLTSDTAVRLVRLDVGGGVERVVDFIDGQALTDPFYGDIGVLRNPQSLVPYATRDAARVAAIGEDVAIALRTGRNAVVAYRYQYNNLAGGFTRAWRTLVEPGAMIGSVFLTSGTFDPYAGLDNQWRLLMDADATGRVAVGVSLTATEVAAAHAQHFSENIDPMLVQGMLVTGINAQGQRISTTAFKPGRKVELHALRWAGQDIVIGGRVFTEARPDGGGWDAFAGVTRLGAPDPVSYRVLDNDRGDIIQDLVPLSDGTLLAGGSTGYIQNPTGGSISEEARPMLLVLEATGQLRRRITVTGGARHNQVRSLAPYRLGYLAAGMANGPGTHSADTDASKLVADGYVAEVNLAP